jgi:hypothetical protein
MDTVNKFADTERSPQTTISFSRWTGIHSQVLILPNDIPAHPYAVAMEVAMLAPRSEVQYVSVEGIQRANSVGCPAGAVIR